MKSLHPALYLPERGIGAFYWTASDMKNIFLLDIKKKKEKTCAIGYLTVPQKNEVFLKKTLFLKKMFCS
jgi:hypothetical protein